MAFEFVRGYVQLASGLGELTKARATEAAQGLLSLPAAEEVSKRALQVGEIADQLLEAARANRENLVALVRGEVETALGRADVVHLADFDRARTALAALTREVEELRDSLLAEASRTPLGRALPGVRPTEETAVAAGAALTPARRETVAGAAEETAATPARKATAKRAAARKSTAKTTARKATAKKAAAGSTTKSASARKSSASKASASKSAAKKTARKSTAKKSTAKKSTAKKSTAKKATSTGNGNG
jgi:hypothetical protein